MASFADCIRSAQKQGVKISDEEAEDLIRRYEEHRAARAAAGERDPEGAAKTALIAEKEAEAARKRFVGALAAEKAGAIKQYLTDFRTLDGKADVFEAVVNLLENYGGGTSAVKNRAEAIARMTHAEIDDVLGTFRRSRLTGGRFNKPQVDNVVREILGESTGSPEAKAMAEALSSAFERRRNEFNAAGGDIGNLDGGYLPQYHDPRALLNKGYAGWRDYILPKLDTERMVDPLTGGKLTPERLEAGLKAAYNNIVTGGWASREPSMAPVGKGALANQRGEHRFLHFKTADDWLAYNREFGHGDPMNAIINHIRSMSHDIAALEVLGPNPGATKEWLKQIVESESGKALIGEPSLIAGKPDIDTGKKLGSRIDAIYDAVRGQEIIGGRTAMVAADVRNVLTSAYLGSTSILAAATDPFIDRTARAFNGLPATRALVGIAYAFKNENTRAQAVRAGLGLDDFMHTMGNEARWAGSLGGHQWSKWLADRTIQLSGLEPITQARKHRFGLDWMGAVADHAGMTFDELGAAAPYLRRSFDRYGFTEKEWDRLRATAHDIPGEGSAGQITPRDVKNRELGLKYLEMILGETERAVPTGTARSRSIVTGSLQRGTVFGEIAQGGLQFKSFTLSFSTMQWQALQQELHVGAARGAGYAASLFIPLTLGGALSLQLNSLASTKDLQPMDPTTAQGIKFWLQALFKGGGLGLIGDFIFADMTRFSHSPAEQLSGPTISLASDMLKLTVGNLQKVAQGKTTHVARDTLKLIGRNVPIISTLPYTRAAYQRMVLDQLQYLTDPDAHKYFRDAEKKLRRETGQGYWWPPGATTPERAPEWPDARK